MVGKGGGEPPRRKSGGRALSENWANAASWETPARYRPEFSFNNRVIIHRDHLLLDSKSARCHLSTPASSCHFSAFFDYARRVFSLWTAWINWMFCRLGEAANKIMVWKNGISVQISVDRRSITGNESLCLSLIGNFNCLITEALREASVPLGRISYFLVRSFSRNMLSPLGISYASILDITRMLGYGESKSYPRARNMSAVSSHFAKIFFPNSKCHSCNISKTKYKWILEISPCSYVLQRYTYNCSRHKNTIVYYIVNLKCSAFFKELKDLIVLITRDLPTSFMKYLIMRII